MAEINNVIAEASQDLKTIEDFVNLPAGSDVRPRLLPSVNVGTLAGTRDAIFKAGGLPTEPFETKAQMETDGASLADGQLAMVHNDTANNGLYVKTAGAWVKSAYDPLTQAKDYTDTSAAVLNNEINEIKKESKNNLKGIAGKNLFNKDNVIVGKSLDASGVERTDEKNSLSEYIQIEAGSDYFVTNSGSTWVFDNNKVFLHALTGGAQLVAALPAGGYIRTATLHSKIPLVQVEKGSVGTAYEAFRLISAKDSVNKNAIMDRAVDGEKIDYSSIRPEHFEGAVFANMHNPEKLRKGISLSLTNGITETVNANIDLTEFIPCKPNKTYSAGIFSRVFFYDKDKNFISLVSASPFTTPENCYFIRANLSSLVSDRFQINEGDILTSPAQPYTFTIPNLNSGGSGDGDGGTSPVVMSDYRTRKYSFADAWIAWKSNKKFPICFVGDSTMEGYGTSNFTRRSLGGFGIDWPHTNNPNAYQSLFQDMIRAATGNTVMRTYNASYGGQGSNYAAKNIDLMLSGDYADTKMVALGHGINDYFSTNFPFHATYYEDHLETVIKAVFAKGMQPFFVTTQPITMPSSGGGDRNLRNAELSREIALKLAHKYNLEVIDVNTHAEHFMRYSSKPLYNNIMEDNHNTIHFGDSGHKFTADLFYATFNPHVIWTTEGEQLDYMTQRVRSDILFDELTQMPTVVDGFKNQVVLTQETAVDKLYQHFEVFNMGRKQLALTAHYANAAVGQYAEVNSVPTTITTQAQALGSLDLGLHIIKAKSSATTALDWRGFKLKPVV